MTRSVPQPPFPADLLADLHAGSLDPELSAQLWPVVRRDPEARRYLRSLDEVRAHLADIGSSETVHHPMPDDIAARLNAFAESLAGDSPVLDSGTAGFAGSALESDVPAAQSTTAQSTTAQIGAAQSAEATVPLTQPDPGVLRDRETSHSTASSRPTDDPSGRTSEARTDTAPISLAARRRRTWGVLAAAATVLIAAGATLFVSLENSGPAPSPTAAPTSGLSETPAALDTAVALRAMNRNDVSGRLGDRTALTDCVRAAGVDRPILGSTDMNFQGRAAVLVLVAGRNGAQITALVVGTGCTPGDPQVLNVTDIG